MNENLGSLRAVPRNIGAARGRLGMYSGVYNILYTVYCTYRYLLSSMSTVCYVGTPRTIRYSTYGILLYYERVCVRPESLPPTYGTVPIISDKTLYLYMVRAR